MSGAQSSLSESGVPLSSLPTYASPAPADLVFGFFNGQMQFVPQEQIWTGALSTSGGTVTGAIAGVTPTQPAHLATKAYVDSVGGAVSQQVAPMVSAAAMSAQNALNYAQGAANAASTALSAQKGNPNGLAPLSGNGNLVLGGVEFMGVVNGLPVIIIDLPTADPGVAKALWTNGGYVMQSLGPAGS